MAINIDRIKKYFKMREKVDDSYSDHIHTIDDVPLRASDIKEVVGTLVLMEKWVDTHSIDIKAIHDGVETMGQLVDSKSDTIDALESELEDAVRVCYDRGAVDYVKTNYPKLFIEFEKRGKKS